ncbi:MAG: hypothetical protein Q8891_13930 [Bacteroidota bacterium]|nr:hypothetical protein [Bacteroidota bacterium]
MTDNDAIIFLADEIIKHVKNRIEFDLNSQLIALKIEFNLDNQKITSDKTDFTDEEIKIFTLIQQIPNYQVRDFMIDEGYIKESDAPNFYKLTKLGREIKSVGNISKYKRQKEILINQIELDNRQARLNQKLLVYGAIGAAVGAIGLVIWEVFLFFYCKKQ